MAKWVNFPFPKSGRMSLCICSLPPTPFLQAEGQGAEVWAEVLLWPRSLPLSECVTHVALTQFSPRCWVVPGRAKILKELKSIPSAQIWDADLSKYLVPGSNYCADIKFLPVSKAHPWLCFKHSPVAVGTAPCWKQTGTCQWQNPRVSLRNGPNWFCCLCTLKNTILKALFCWVAHYLYLLCIAHSIVPLLDDL